MAVWALLWIKAPQRLNHPQAGFDHPSPAAFITPTSHRKLVNSPAILLQRFKVAADRVPGAAELRRCAHLSGRSKMEKGAWVSYSGLSGAKNGMRFGQLQHA